MTQGALAPAPTDAATVETFDRHLRIHWPEERAKCADFHYRWLRHNCDADRHPKTGERTVDAADIPADVHPAWARVVGNALVIEWARPSGLDLEESRVSVYPLAWLREHAYAVDRETVSPPPSRVATIAFDARSLSPVDAAREALSRTLRDGVAVVRGFAGARAPEQETKTFLDAMCGLGLQVRTTHFGAIEDLRTDNTTNANTDQLGYTDAAIDLHTDQPFLEDPPRFQALHCIREASEGGENQVVDAFAAARYLRSIDAAADDILRSTPVRFHRKQLAFEAIVDSPILVGEGDEFRVRSSYFTFAPHRIAFERMEAFYEAYARFSRLVRDPRHQYALTLSPGDILFYDNARMLHARSAFRGQRWLRGIYFDRPAEGPSR